MSKKIDYLIVGQGLAGTFLAFQLMKQNKSFLVVDKGHESSSSYIAAGIMNPLVLRRITLGWRAGDFLQYNSSFYQELECLLKCQYHFQLPIHQIIQNEEAEDFWKHRFEKAELQNYMKAEPTEINAVFKPSIPSKVGEAKHTSWLNISKLLNDFRTLLIKKQLLIEEEFNYAALDKNQYQSIRFNKIVFCEGAAAAKNPFFNYLPFSLNKGQLITIESDELPTTSILKKRVFILPTTKNQFKVGATYAWKWNSDTEAEKEKTGLLKEQLAEITTAAYKVIKEEAGVRPAVKDRRPLIGVHPEKDNYYLFNGMGSKGCFMAPLLSKEFLSFTDKGEELEKECDLKRFKPSSIA